MGTFGIHKGQVYNARVENIHGNYWGPIWDLGWRGLVKVNGFIEGNRLFKLVVDEPVHLAVLYNDANEFAIITMPPVGCVVGVHNRMPMIIVDDNLWLKEGKVAEFKPDILRIAA